VTPIRRAVVRPPSHQTRSIGDTVPAPLEVLDDLVPSSPRADAAEEQAALAAVSRALDGVGRLGVAFSGGVDSAALLAAAVRVLGPGRVVAILGVSPSLATDERAAAHEVAQVIGAALVEVATDEGSLPAYRANGPDRCFHCKNELFERISDEVVAAHALDAVAYGENADDAVRPDRPGSRAAVEHRVLAPLRDAGLDKAAVRRLARTWALPCADKPAAPCLASRIPHHTEVTPEKLGQVDRAEQALRRLGFADARVRHHGDVARVELPAEDLARAVSEPLRGQVREAVVGAGFRFAALDLGGMQSGVFTLTALGRRA
jgi:pyridinium-3,5-biscarboxylic acid mononucleotide sulfurtransferase